ncbi:MAG TPA: ABC transporter substrate-binding protein [Streptosporangiales bacterium]
MRRIHLSHGTGQVRGRGLRSMLGAVAVAAVLVAGCSAGAPSGAGGGAGNANGKGGGKSITIAYANDIEGWSPYATLNNLTYSRWSNVFEPLVQYADGTYKGVLATSWSTKGAEWTFHLRKGVKFQDGQPFTAADVVHSFNRAKNDKSSLQTAHTAHMRKVTALDDNTVQVTTDGQYAVLLSDITSLFITSKATFDKYGAAKADEHPNGTGPYSFVSWQKGVSFTVKKNPHYWGNLPANMPTQMIFRVIPNPVDAVAALQRGEVDIVPSVLFQNVDTISKGKSTHIIAVDGIRTMFYGFQVTMPPFNDLRVRQAITYAIDVPKIIKNVLQNEVTPMNGPVPALVFGSDPHSTNPYPYNPAKAKQLLKEAGAVGKTITLTSTNGTTPGDTETSQTVQEMLQKVGLKVKIVTPDFATQSADLEAGKLGFYLGNRGNYFDANVFLSQYFQGGISKRTGYSNPKVNKLMKEQAAELDPKKRVVLLHQAEAQIMKDAPAVFFGAFRDVYGVTNRISWKPSTDEFLRGINVSVS